MAGKVAQSDNQVKETERLDQVYLPALEVVTEKLRLKFRDEKEQSVLDVATSFKKKPTVAKSGFHKDFKLPKIHNGSQFKIAKDKLFGYPWPYAATCKDVANESTSSVKSSYSASTFKIPEELTKGKRNLKKFISKLHDESYIHVRPGFSAARYITSVTRLWNPDAVEDFINQNKLDPKLHQNYLKLALPDVNVDGLLFKDSLLRKEPKPYHASLDHSHENGYAGQYNECEQRRVCRNSGLVEDERTSVVDLSMPLNERYLSQHDSQTLSPENPEFIRKVLKPKDIRILPNAIDNSIACNNCAKSRNHASSNSCSKGKESVSLPLFSTRELSSRVSFSTPEHMASVAEKNVLVQGRLPLVNNVTRADQSMCVKQSHQATYVTRKNELGSPAKLPAIRFQQSNDHLKCYDARFLLKGKTQLKHLENSEESAGFQPIGRAAAQNRSSESFLPVKLPPIVPVSEKQNDGVAIVNAEVFSITPRFPYQTKKLAVTLSVKKAANAEGCSIKAGVDSPIMMVGHHVEAVCTTGQLRHSQREVVEVIRESANGHLNMELETDKRLSPDSFPSPGGREAEQEEAEPLHLHCSTRRRVKDEEDNVKGEVHGFPSTGARSNSSLSANEGVPSSEVNVDSDTALQQTLGRHLRIRKIEPSSPNLIACSDQTSTHLSPMNMSPRRPDATNHDWQHEQPESGMRHACYYHVPNQCDSLQSGRNFGSPCPHDVDAVTEGSKLPLNSFFHDGPVASQGATATSSKYGTSQGIDSLVSNSCMPSSPVASVENIHSIQGQHKSDMKHKLSVKDNAPLPSKNKNQAISILESGISGGDLLAEKELSQNKSRKKRSVAVNLRDKNAALSDVTFGAKTPLNTVANLKDSQNLGYATAAGKSVSEKPKVADKKSKRKKTRNRSSHGKQAGSVGLTSATLSAGESKVHESKSSVSSPSAPVAPASIGRRKKRERRKNVGVRKKQKTDKSTARDFPSNGISDLPQAGSLLRYGVNADSKPPTQLDLARAIRPSSQPGNSSGSLKNSDAKSSVRGDFEVRPNKDLLPNRDEIAAAESRARNVNLFPMPSTAHDKTVYNNVQCPDKQVGARLFVNSEVSSLETVVESIAAPESNPSSVPKAVERETGGDTKSVGIPDSGHSAAVVGDAPHAIHGVDAELRRAEVDRRRKEKKEAQRKEEENRRMLAEKMRQELEFEDEQRRLAAERKRREAAEENARRLLEQQEQLQRESEERKRMERDKMEREKFQRKMLEMADKLRLEVEIKREQERIAAEEQAEMLRKEQDLLRSMAEAERRAYEKQKIEEQMIREREAKERDERLRLQLQEEEMTKDRLLKHLAEKRQLAVEKQAFTTGVVQMNLLLEYRRRLTPAFTYSYYGISPGLASQYEGNTKDLLRSKVPGDLIKQE